MPALVFTTDAAVARRIQLLWGTRPIHLPKRGAAPRRPDRGRRARAAACARLIRPGECVDPAHGLPDPGAAADQPAAHPPRSGAVGAPGGPAPALAGAPAGTPVPALRLIPLRDSQKSKRFAWATALLVLACAGTFAWELSLGSRAEAEIAALGDLAERGRRPRRAAPPAAATRGLALPPRRLAPPARQPRLPARSSATTSRASSAAVRFLALYLLCGLVATAARSPPIRARSSRWSAPRARSPACSARSSSGSRRRGSPGVLPLGCLILPMKSRAFLLHPVLVRAPARGRPRRRGRASNRAGVAWYAHLAGFAGAGRSFARLLRRR